MASYVAIAATAETIAGLLRRAAKDVFPNAAIETYVGSKFDAPMTEGLSLLLYRVAITGARRNLPPTVGADGRRRRPPLPLDLYFLLTAWSENAGVQHRLLGWAMRQLENTPVLHASLLNGSHTGPEQDIFRPGEAVELLCDPLPLPDMINLWEALKPKHNRHLSVSYVARMIAIESDVLLDEFDPVQTRAFDYGKVPPA